MAKGKNKAAAANEATEETKTEAVETGKPKTGLTDEQKAELAAKKAEDKAARDAEKAAKAAEKKAERELAQGQKKAAREAEKAAALEAKEQQKQARLEALGPLREAVDQAEADLKAATSAIDEKKAALAAARLELRKAGGGSSGSALVDRDITSRYVKHDVKTPGGRKSTNNNDRLALATMGFSAAQMIELLDTHGIEHKDWSHLNPGMQRMNAGNVLRTQIKKGKAITVGDTVVDGL